MPTSCNHTARTDLSRLFFLTLFSSLFDLQFERARGRRKSRGFKV